MQLARALGLSSLYYEAIQQQASSSFHHVPFPHPQALSSSTRIGLFFFFTVPPWAEYHSIPQFPICSFPWYIWRHCTIPPRCAPQVSPPCSGFRSASPIVKAKSYFVPTTVKLACFLFSFSFTCIALGIYCPTTKRLIRGRTDSSQQIETLASVKSAEDSTDERATAPRNDWTITNRWRFYVNIRFGVALNLAEGANAVWGVMNTLLVVLLAIAVGCTGVVTVSPLFILGW